LLVNGGADVDYSLNIGTDTDTNNLPRGGDENQQTPLMLACAFDSDGYVVRELALNGRANAALSDKDGFNPLHYASFQGNRNVFEIVNKT
jgi:ankyrin repeat protein